MICLDFWRLCRLLCIWKLKICRKKDWKLERKSHRNLKRICQIFSLWRQKKLVVFDNFSNKIKIIINTFLDTGSYDQSIEEIAHIEDELKKENNFEPKDFSLKASEEAFDSNFSKEDVIEFLWWKINSFNYLNKLSLLFVANFLSIQEKYLSVFPSIGILIIVMPHSN